MEPLTGKLEVKVAVLAERMKAVDSKLEVIADNLEEFKENVTRSLVRLDQVTDKLEKATDERIAFENRWRGGVLALVSIGGVLGWIFTYWEKFSSWLLKGA